MIVINVRIKRTWIPAESGRAVDYQWTTHGLMTRLPAMGVAEVNRYGGPKSTLDQIRLNVTVLHDWSTGADIAIELQPDEIEGTKDEREYRSHSIAWGLRRAVEHYLDGRDGPRPSTDVECCPRSRSGSAYDAEGQLTQQWGVPQALRVGAAVIESMISD